LKINGFTGNWRRIYFMSTGDVLPPYWKCKTATHSTTLFIVPTGAALPLF